MPYERKQISAAGNVARYRLRFEQQEGGRSLQWVSRKTKELGYPISAGRIGECLNGMRRISTDEMTALATALGIPASSLILDKTPGVPDTSATLSEIESRIFELEAWLRKRHSRAVLEELEALSIEHEARERLDSVAGTK